MRIWFAPARTASCIPMTTGRRSAARFRVAGEPAVRRMMSEKAEKSVQKYGLDTVFPALTTLYYDTLTGKTGRAASEEEN